MIVLDGSRRELLLHVSADAQALSHRQFSTLTPVVSRLRFSKASIVD